MSERHITRTIEVVKKGNEARLQLREFDDIFTYQLPLRGGEVDKMRGYAKWFCNRDKSLVYGEINLEKLRELSAEARKRHPRV